MVGALSQSLLNQVNDFHKVKLELPNDGGEMSQSLLNQVNDFHTKYMDNIKETN